MTFDVVGLCRREPDAETLVSAIRAASPLSEVDTDEDRLLFLLRHPEGRLLLAIESARLVRAPGEVRRLLGVDVPPPVWWVEGRAPEGDSEAETAARRFTAALVAATGGESWASR
ncbi:hypothetical protein ACFQ05_02005 [Amycolatopsis umgeniensis]|uniref:Uncharacterized protein n=1 Tax=Amycolatopsis umgeniensis TaxID=336628 RepID=A0A841AZH1_9PSEU|nr:hypothetical protein [Amycolatopsis umgeniensis]MBB5852031.1 hypothetical protein [Amycolatopsis umgeniensis]